jgi:hypothetical protein
VKHFFFLLIFLNLNWKFVFSRLSSMGFYIVW